MEQPPTPGQWLLIELTLPGGEAVTVRGKVAHAVSPAEALSRGSQPGIGVEFVSLTEHQRRFLVELVGDASGSPS